MVILSDGVDLRILEIIDKMSSRVADYQFHEFKYIGL